MKIPGQLSPQPNALFELSPQPFLPYISTREHNSDSYFPDETILVAPTPRFPHPSKTATQLTRYSGQHNALPKISFSLSIHCPTYRKTYRKLPALPDHQSPEYDILLERYQSLTGILGIHPSSLNS